MPEEHHDRYTHGHSSVVLACHNARTAEESLAYALDRLHPGMSFLDVGCGAGTITTGVARLVAPGRVVGVDRDEGVLKQARQSARDEGLTNIDFQVMDAYDLACEDASFDVVHAHYVLHHLTDPVAALAEMKRVARPGGLVAVREPAQLSSQWYPDSDGLALWKRMNTGVIAAAGGEPDSARHLLAWVHAAGLVDCQVTTSTTSYFAGESAHWMGQTWAERLRHSDIVTEVVKAGLATPADVETAAQAWLDWSEHPDAWFAFMSTEVLASVEGCSSAPGL